MNELDHSATNLQEQMREKEIRVKSILDTVDELVTRDIVERNQPEDSRYFNVSATYREAHDDDRMGLLSFTKQPDLDPNSFLEITYNEHGFGDKRNETDKTYVFTRTNDGDTLVQVSDAISLDGFNAAMAEAAEFGNQTKKHNDSDPEMHTQAWDGLETDAHEALVQEKQEAALSLKPATASDLAKLEEIIAIAKDRTDWDQVDFDDKTHDGTTTDHDLDASPVRSSRIQKLARRVGHFFTFRQ